MEMFARLMNRGDTVLDVGGHIAFISQYLSYLCGASGRVVVFEPGSNNLVYARKNASVRENIRLEEVAVSDRVGEVELFEENVSGENNSLLPSYDASVSNARNMGIDLVKTTRKVATTTIDHYVSSNGLAVDFLKLDVEGAEVLALAGAERTLAKVRALMVEVNAGNQTAVSMCLQRNGFRLMDPAGSAMPTIPCEYIGNVFGVRENG